MSAAGGSGHTFVVEWREGFKVGIERVDAQHKHLFNLVKGLDLATIDKTMDELLNYVVEHFSTEQDLMEQYNYPEFRNHLNLHEEFAASVGDFLGTGDDWDEERLLTLRKFLNKWLIRHIMVHDLRFGRWYQQHKDSTPQATSSEGQKSKRGLLARLLGRGD